MPQVRRSDGMLTSAQADRLVGGRPGLTRKWRQRGRIIPDDYDERGNPLYFAATVRAAEKQVNQNGLSRNGTHPRKQRTGFRMPVTPAA